MSTISGAFDETTLLNQRIRADQLFGFDSRIALQFTPQYEVLKAITAAQTAQLRFSNRKDFDLTIMWENFCDIVAEACTNDCNVGGKTSSTNTEDKSIAWCKEVNFSLDEYDFRDNEFDMNLAKMLLKADKELTESFARYSVAQLEAFKGVNVVTTGKGTVAGTTTNIPAAFWTPALVAYFNRVQIMNKFSSPIFASGSLLYESSLTAQAMSANADGKGDWALWASLQPYFDLFNIDTVNNGTLKAYLINMGSIATAFKHYNPDVPERGFDHWRYTMPSRFTGATYDVFYKNSCSHSDKSLFKHDYTIKMKGDIFLNPQGCSSTNTGVLMFQCT